MPSCWKATITDRAFIGNPKPAAEASRVFSCKASTPGASSVARSRPCAEMRAPPPCPLRTLRAGANAAESSRSFRANALVRREILDRIATVRVLSVDVARVRSARVAMASMATRANHMESLQAAPLLACVASMRCASTQRAPARHARMRREGGGARCVRGRSGEKLRERLLTLEKSVIRFRPADISCGIK